MLFQHLFWFYSHPAVYIMILPGMGVVSELIPCFARKPVFGYNFDRLLERRPSPCSAFWSGGITCSSPAQSVYAAMVFSLLSFLVAIPSAIKVFNWTATLYKGSISFDTPMLYALGFIGLFTIGGLTGLFLAALGMDVHVHDTYFVDRPLPLHHGRRHGHGLHGRAALWWPKITGRMYPEGWGKLAALIIFIGFNLTFFPQFVLGYLGMPRRYRHYAPEFQVLNVMSSAGASILGVGYLLPLVYFIWSLKLRRRLPGRIRGAPPGLEWQTPSPPPTDNFAETPVVTAGALPLRAKEVNVVG